MNSFHNLTWKKVQTSFSNVTVETIHAIAVTDGTSIKEQEHHSATVDQHIFDKACLVINVTVQFN